MGILDTLKSVGGYDMAHNFFHPEEGYDAAEDAANKYYREAKGYQMPFMQHGLDQYGDLNTARQRLMNPAELENDWASQYETSPYAKRMLETNKGSGLDAASAMGLLGSSGALQNIQQGAGDIVAKDRREFLNDLMEKYMKGIGLGSDIYNTGANAASDLAGKTISHGNDIAGLEYRKTNAPGDLFGRIAGAGGNAAMNYFMPGSSVLTGASNNYNPSMGGR